MTIFKVTECLKLAYKLTFFMLSIIFVLCTSNAWAQTEEVAPSIIGDWQFRAAGMRCEHAVQYNKNNTDWPVKTLSFHEDGTMGIRYIRDLMGSQNVNTSQSFIVGSRRVFDTFYGKYRLQGDTIICTENPIKTTNEAIKTLSLNIKKVNDKKLTVTYHTKFKPFLGPGEDHCKITIFYNRKK